MRFFLPSIWILRYYQLETVQECTVCGGSLGTPRSPRHWLAQQVRPASLLQGNRQDALQLRQAILLQVRVAVDSTDEPDYCMAWYWLLAFFCLSFLFYFILFYFYLFFYFYFFSSFVLSMWFSLSPYFERIIFQSCFFVDRFHLFYHVVIVFYCFCCFCCFLF
jgi:hypothetical protein